MKLGLRAVSTGVIAIAVVASAACGHSNNQAQVYDETSGGTTCFTQMTEEQKAQLVEYTNSQGNQIQNAGDNPDGTQDICVLESDGNGGYNERYYGQEDHFNDYLLYSMMFGHSNALMTYGLISGDLDYGDALALSLLTGVNSHGGLYSPYQHTSAGWGYQPTVRQNVRVTNVYYGSTAKPVAFDKATPPKEYQAKTLPTKAPEAMAGSYVTDKNGKKVLNQTGSTGAAQTLKDAKPAPVKLPGAKQVAPAPNVPNPATKPAPVPVAAAPAPTTAPKPPVSVAPAPSPKPQTQAPAPKPESKPAPKPAPKPQTQAPAPKAAPKVVIKPAPPKPVTIPKSGGRR